MGKNYAVILAAGKGKRMNAKINKQFLQLDGKPVLYHTINAFSKCNDIDGIILVSAKEEIDYCKVEVVEKYNFNKVVSIIEGGKERQDSVLNGLEALEDKDCSVVLIHDGARPFVSEDIISKGIESATKHGASACGVQPKDTIKVIGENNFSQHTLDRNVLFSIQTPQCFNYELILNCHRKLKEEEVPVTDDTMVVERYGHRVYLYNGSYDNIKITTPEDMVIGESILLKNK